MISNFFRLVILIFIALIACSPVSALADEEDDIVTGCHFSNAEWGAQMIDLCINENRARRAEVLAYPEKYKRFVERCRRGNEYGWSMVKSCVDKDIDAEAALATYPKNQAGLIRVCEAEFTHRGVAAVKKCVDKAVNGGDSPTNTK